MSRALAFGDIQVYPYAEWSKPTGTGRTALLDLCEQTFEWLLTIIEVEEIDVVVFLGDLFQRNDIIDTPSFDLACEWMQKIRDAAKDGFALVGNHDIYSKNAQVHSMRWLKSAGWKVIDKPAKKRIFRDAPIALMIPYGPAESVAKIVSAKSLPSLLFGHFDVREAPLRPGFPDKRGVDLSSASTTAFIGHYHHPDVQVGQRGVRVFVGAPFHRNWSDVPTPIPRGATILNFEDGELDDFVHIENPHTPLFEVLDVTKEKRITATESIETFVRNHVAPERCFLRVYVTQGDEEMARSLTQNFRSAKIIPSRHGAVSGVARHSIPVVELTPEKILAQQVLGDKTTKLAKKKLIGTGKRILELEQSDD